MLVPVCICEVVSRGLSHYLLSFLMNLKVCKAFIPVLKVLCEKLELVLSLFLTLEVQRRSLVPEMTL